jgi:hypothetical protein
MLPKDKLEAIRAVNNQLTKETTLVIEESLYSKMVIRDVNNYQAVYSDNKREDEHIKLKGCFEIDKEYHKDPSMRIVPIALKEYFVYNVPIIDTIYNHKDIYDFCLRLKTNSSCTPYYRHLDKDKGIVNDKLDRTTRYYISNSGGVLVKDFGDGRINGVNIGYNVTLFNEFQKRENYDINYNFYITEINKIKNVVEDKQLSLWDGV